MLFGGKPVGIQSGSSRDASGTNFAFFWHCFWPVGIQSGTNFVISSTCREAAKFVQKTRFLHGFGTFLCFPTGPKVVPKTAKLVPDRIPTGSMNLEEPALAPIFLFPDPPLPLFSLAAHQPCSNTPPILHQNGKSSLKPNRGSTSYIDNLTLGGLL